VRLYLRAEILVGLLVLASAVGAGAQTEDTYTIRLRTRALTPVPGFDIGSIMSQRAGGPDDSVHFLLQFYNLPDAAARQQLATQGITLINYVSGNAYIASARVGDLDRLSSLDGARWAGPLEPSDKVAPALAACTVGEWARVGEERVALTIQVHPDVPISEAEALVARQGGTLLSSVPAVPSVSGIFRLSDVDRIASEDAVQYVDIVDPPLRPADSPSSTGGAAAVTTSPAAVEPVGTADPTPSLPAEQASRC
jgi:hypothetical protein